MKKDKLNHPFQPYMKLIRDKLPTLIQKNNQIAFIKKANSEQYEFLLHNKIIEETNELLFQTPSTTQKIEKFADIFEALYKLIEIYDFPLDKINKVRKQKNKQRGKFEKKLILLGIMDKNEYNKLMLSRNQLYAKKKKS